MSIVRIYFDAYTTMDTPLNAEARCKESEDYAYT